MGQPLPCPGSKLAEGTLSKVTGEDRWIYRISIEDIITLQYGIEIPGSLPRHQEPPVLQ